MHLPCYGRLFPSLAWRQNGKERTDGVFSYLYPPPGMVARPPEVLVDLEAWDHCLECREFETCRRLSSAKFLLETALRN
jgi:hypothetical protein